MKLVYEGKTKIVYEQEDGNYLLKFKDDVTCANGIFDPGANTTGIKIEGIGKEGIRLTEYFFKKIATTGYPTHFISANIKNNTIIVKPAKIFGHGLEIVCRYKATGSFIKRYGAYATEGQSLDAFVEITLKDDGREDPPITKDALIMLGILTCEEYETLKDLTKKICNVVKNELSKKDIELYDIKLEFGRCNNQITLIDEISGGNMRAYKNNKIIPPIDLAKLIIN
jgi:phosphoribosylaminoimidazole-succinocarboxamide synthase